MSVFLPRIGVTLCQISEVILEKFPENIVGSFWVMCERDGSMPDDIPDWWIDSVASAQDIIDAFKAGCFDGQHQNPLYLGFCIIVVGNPLNPIDLSYVIQHTRMWEEEGIGLLEIMAKHNIPAHTEVTYPQNFLWKRYRDENKETERLKNLHQWSVQIWEDYCSYLMAEHGQDMLSDFIEKKFTQ